MNYDNEDYTAMEVLEFSERVGIDAGSCLEIANGYPHDYKLISIMQYLYHVDILRTLQEAKDKADENLKLKLSKMGINPDTYKTYMNRSVNLRDVTRNEVCTNSTYSKALTLLFPQLENAILNCRHDVCHLALLETLTYIVPIENVHDTYIKLTSHATTSKLETTDIINALTHDDSFSTYLNMNLELDVIYPLLEHAVSNMSYHVERYITLIPHLAEMRIENTRVPTRRYSLAQLASQGF